MCKFSKCMYQNILMIISILKGLNQAKIIIKSAIFFGFLTWPYFVNMHVQNKKYGNFVSISRLTVKCAAQKLKKNSSSSLWTCLHHIVILKSQNKITIFFILAWSIPFNAHFHNYNTGWLVMNNTLQGWFTGFATRDNKPHVGLRWQLGAVCLTNISEIIPEDPAGSTGFQ